MRCLWKVNMQLRGFLAAHIPQPESKPQKQERYAGTYQDQQTKTIHCPPPGYGASLTYACYMEDLGNACCHGEQECNKAREFDECAKQCEVLLRKVVVGDHTALMLYHPDHLFVSRVINCFHQQE